MGHARRRPDPRPTHTSADARNRPPVKPRLDHWVEPFPGLRRSPSGPSLRTGCLHTPELALHLSVLPGAGRQTLQTGLEQGQRSYLVTPCLCLKTLRVQALEQVPVHEPATSRTGNRTVRKLRVTRCA